jgi:hypothetical protein
LDFAEFAHLVVDISALNATLDKSGLYQPVLFTTGIFGASLLPVAQLHSLKKFNIIPFWISRV